MSKINLRETLTFGFEQTFTVPEWWNDEGFTATSDTPLKREKMLALAKGIAEQLNGSFKESLDIWNHMQYETFNQKGEQSFYVTMDPGSIEVKTPPCLAKDAASMALPLFEAAKKANVVPYRNWWYGVKGGTEGGCHVNMGGFTPEENPLRKMPDLAVKYCAYIHNRPWLHYPFMGIDVGPEGNSMRMDEKKGFEVVKKAFEDYKKFVEKQGNLSPDSIYAHFEKTNLISEKASFPSLFKFKSPLYFIEDRAQEAMRSPEEFEMAAELRLNVLEKLMKEKAPEPLKSFGNLHAEGLTSFYLWDKFQPWAKEMGIDPTPYHRYFERQFPKLSMGENVPKLFGIKEGRRPRVVKDVIKRGDTIVSKTIDTRFKRFELFFHEGSNSLQFEIQGEGIEEISPLFASESGSYLYVDVKMDSQNPQLEIALVNLQREKALERGSFNMNNMMWV